MKLLHVSDLHFHQDQAKNAQVNARLGRVKERYPEHHVLVTGDITDDGHPAQYANARAALQPFVGRVHICPGNHDFGATGMFYSADRARRFDSELSVPLGQAGCFYGANAPLVSVVNGADAQVMFIALDSNLETTNLFDFSCGEIGDLQLAALDAILAAPANRDYVKVLFFHHHPFIRKENDPFMALLDAPKLWRTVWGRVDVIAFGHKHVRQRWDNYGGAAAVLASDSTAVGSAAFEITVTGRTVSVADVPLV